MANSEKGMAATLATIESQPNKAAERGKAMRQVIAAFIANLGTINTGLIFGFSAVVIPQLQATDSLIPVDESQSSWVDTRACILVSLIDRDIVGAARSLQDAA